jgi:hypothetical protein
MLNWQLFRDQLTAYLKQGAVKMALLKFLGPAAAGWQVWLVSFIAEELFEEIAEPVIRLTFRKAGWVYNRIEGEVTLKRIEDAKKTGNASKYIKSISGV